MQNGYEIPLELIGAQSAADMTGKRYVAVKFDTDGKMAMVAAGENAIGVLQNEPVADEMARVMTLGTTIARAGDTITAGANVTVDANGHFVAAGVGDAVIGVARHAAVDGDLFPVLLTVKASAGTNGIAYGVTTLAIPVTLSQLDDVAVVTNLTPAFTGEINRIYFVGNVVTTDAADSNCVITPDIDGVPVTGGVLTLDVDVPATDPDTMGKVVDATAITALNAVTPASEITLTVANTANAFADGSGTLYIEFKITE